MSTVSDPSSLATVEWGVATRALGGGPVSGDLYAAIQHGSHLLLAVVDGLGHGPPAELAATTAIAALEQHANQPLPELFTSCHQRLLLTRGVVMSVAAIDLTTNHLTWAGVGNVDACLVRVRAGGRQALLQQGGVVGYNLPPVRPNIVSLDDGDILVFATDGIRHDYHTVIRATAPPDEAAQEILATYGRDSDDALVLVARYHRAPP